MKKLTILSATLLSSALILSACSSTSDKKEETNKQTATSSTSENKAIQAFDFTAMDKDGKTVKLSDFKGKKVYINMWASWCGPCMREIPELEKTYQKLKNNKDVVFLSMTSPNDSEFKNQSPQDKGKDVILNKAKELGVTYPVLFDVNDRFIINYAIRSFPTHIFINSDGTIGNRIAGGVTEELLTKEIEKLK
ncbi:TlpA disulfide reductase family protein [Gemella haemolysans]|jgi:cytochrome C biogenesis protein, transmembrane region family|uniref:TlpA family protein disulfide reductase n=1 Tax=Gemella haemolysans TaxID=1379 RepID=UPI00120188F8|nr:TlpA disulfide reductase family protein [Gemella haemolysans]MDU3832402.1 TlpA disulfide reductase family protein [Gemella haemolysans]MDU6766618.1 TlpA disulfide reductase family protein [Gemella haemolysans]TKW64099.1 MAG: TlpA family protein disulfide reductase [Gemella sp.]